MYLFWEIYKVITEKKKSNWLGKVANQKEQFNMVSKAETPTKW